MNRYLFILVFLLMACQVKNADNQLSAYYWKTRFKLSDTEKKFVADNGVNRLYIRYFDVTLNEGKPKPLAPIIFESIPENITVVPVVYIKNEVFKAVDVNALELAQKIHDYIVQINTKHKIQIDEIQIDCDWTLTTKDNFFEFLKYFKDLNRDKNLSATIRLHQVKYYTKTGIPPVDTGVLMYYNMGDLSVMNQNSIYDKDVANKYITHLAQYPLQLDVALPIFEWGVVIRNQHVIDLVDAQIFNNFIQNTSVTSIDKNLYLSKEEVIIKGKVFQKGDILKIEKIRSEDFKQMVKDLNQAMSNAPKKIILYELSDKYIHNYEKDFFKQIF